MLKNLMVKAFKNIAQGKAISPPANISEDGSNEGSPTKGGKMRKKKKTLPTTFN